MSPESSRERDLVKCEDMRIHAERARKYLGSRSLPEFLSDDMIQAAVIRCVEVIGEAARLVSKVTCDRTPQVRWPLIIGMRHVLAHDYGVVNLDKVYSVVTEHLPQLIEHLAGIIATLEQEVAWSDEEES
jgi:uncharacterized protein with HEPN domain